MQPQPAQVVSRQNAKPWTGRFVAAGLVAFAVAYFLSKPFPFFVGIAFLVLAVVEHDAHKRR